MTAISAGLVKQLREKTQLPMMDCKRALQETEGDLDKAQDLLRKSGAMTAAKKAGRETAEGRTAVYISDDNSKASLVEIRCETAPVANTDDFIEMCRRIAQHVATTDALPANVEALLAQNLDGSTVRDCLEQVVNKIRENMLIARFDLLTSGFIAEYEHHNGQVAAVVQVKSDTQLSPSQELIDFVRGLCMHVAAINPMALDRDQVAAELVEKEKGIIKAQVADQAKNKPAEIVKKIVLGKLNKWYNGLVLLEQPFVKDDKKSVKQIIAEFNKSAGQSISIEKFIRYEVGGTSQA